MIEHHVSFLILNKIYEDCPVGVGLREYIVNMLAPYNAFQKDGMNFTFLFHTEQDVTAFLLQWG